MTLRWGNFPQNSQQRGFFALIFIANFIISGISSFALESYEREIFYKQVNYEKSLQYFVDLMKEVLPNSIIIYQKENLMFQNDETVHLLELDTEAAVEEKLKEIRISQQPIMNSHSSHNNLIGADPSQDSQFLYTYLTNPEKYEKEREFIRLTGIIQKKAETDKIIKEDAGTRYLEIKIGRIKWKGENAIIAIISEDYSSRFVRYLEEQAEYKDKLLATVSHDLRTPLNGVIGILDLVLETITDKILKKSLQIALRSSYLLLFMINDILDFSQIAKGSLRLNPALFDVEEMVRDIAKLIKFQAKKKGLKFIIDNKMPEEENFIFSDPFRIKQVLLNLLGNAMKFTENGFIKLTIQKIKGQCAENRPSVHFSVEDSGCGIKNEDIPKLFQLFGMIRNKTSEKLNKMGIGLGLVISQNLVQVLNKYEPDGKINVKSEYGKGSIFSFPIHPFKIGDEKITETKELLKLHVEESKDNESILNNDREDYYMFTNEEVSKRELIQEIPYHSNLSVFCQVIPMKKILLVDDDQINMLVLRKIFDNFADCEYFVAINGAEAVNLVKKKADENIFFDIIFMDINMPVMDGFEATKKILEMVSKKKIRKVEIIASTANTSLADIDKCYKFGMTDFITKPFTKKDIRNKIDLICKGLVN